MKGSGRFAICSTLSSTVFRPLTIVLWLLLSASAVVKAIEVPGLYQGLVNVSSRTDERERLQAYGPALQQVLLKVTGQPEIFNDAAVRAALRNPQSYVESYSYRSIGAPATGGNAAPVQGNQGIALEVSFFASEILALLNNNNLRVWPSNRPPTIVWAVVQNEQGQRQILNSSADNPVKNLIASEAQRRGLPLLFPLMDITDSRAVNLEQIWNQDIAVLRLASTRYLAESILVIRLVSSLGSEHLGRAVYLFRDLEISQELYGEDLELFIEKPVDLAVSELSGYYSVLLSGSNSGVPVKMAVTGINAPADYAGLLRYVGQLPAVNRVSLLSVNKQTVNLLLETGGQVRQLVESIALGSNMQPMAEITRQDNEIILQYRWLEQ
ncbi:MAG: DUF2066 domain-containing protein [Pseudohongiellaceae bacterium]